jgi:hypothetical protein
MSWKATAFVKELRRNLTVTEKFVLLILAEYHRTDDKLTWPAVSTLADDCLLTERGVLQILERLEGKGFIVRVRGGGRGNRTSYQIVGVDLKKGAQESVNGCAVNVETLSKTLNVCAVNPAQPESCNKDERVLTGNRIGARICFTCEGQRQIQNPGPGRRIIPCPDCCPQVATA